MSAVKQYNGLNGSVATREDLQKLATTAQEQGQIFVLNKIENLLRKFPEEKSFEIELVQNAIDEAPSYALPQLEEATDFTEEEIGLAKPVTPDEIYQYITDLMINTIKEVGHLPWQREWEKTSLYNGFQALNFESKKGYRGINYFLLNFDVKWIGGQPTLVKANLENPYFLTFKQIEKNGGKLKKGSKGKRVVYFTKLYHHEEKLPNGEILQFGTYDKKKFIAWINKNKNRLQILNRPGWSVERLANSYIPILKYYNVFHGADVTGIDWGLIPKNENSEKPKKERIEIAEKIMELFPNKPKIFFEGDQPAYYPSYDKILMTPIEAFKNEESYYCTLFHESVHSTGHQSRLKRSSIVLGGLATKKDYAFEELVAEMGAVFLCAESGLLFSVKDNSAKYLRGWNSRLVDQMKDDNRFFFRASSKAQEAADYILDRDNEGVPAYQNSLKSEIEMKVDEVKNSNEKKKTSRLKKGGKRTQQTKKIKNTSNQLALFGAVPENPTIATAMEFAEKHLIGKSFFVEPLGEEVHFTKVKLKKAMNYPRGSKENIALVYKLPVMMNKAVLFSEEKDKKQRKEIKKVLKLILIENLFGQAYRILITIRKQDKNYYYDHAIIEEIKSEKQDGSVEKINPIPLDVASPIPYKDNKKNITATEKPEKPKVRKNDNLGLKVAAPKGEKAGNNLEKFGFVSANKAPEKPEGIFRLGGELGKLLQDIQRYQQLWLIKGNKHSSKSQLAMQIANAFGEYGDKVAYIDGEQGGMASKDTIDSLNRNTSEEGKKNIFVTGELGNPVEDFREIVKVCSVVVADSIGELGLKPDELNQFRKDHPEIIWVFISQVKENGAMYGGNKMAHNPTLIINCSSNHDYRERIATVEKNRGNSLDPQYNIFLKKVINTEVEETTGTTEAEKPAAVTFNNLVATAIE